MIEPLEPADEPPAPTLRRSVYCPAMAGPRPIRIVQIATGESPARWAAALESLDPRATTVLKQDAGSEVLSTMLLDRRVIIKRSEMSTGDRFKAMLGSSRGRRHWRGAAWLERHGIRTARCHVLAWSERCEWLVMEHLEGSTLLQHLAAGTLGVRQQHAAARAVGDTLARIEASGRSNRDSKPSNLIVLDAESTQPTIAVIDCIALRPLLPAGPLRAAAIARMHASVVLEPIGCRCPIRGTLLLRGLLAGGGSRRQIARRWAAARRLVEAHGDPQPAINPLAPPTLPPTPPPTPPPTSRPPSRPPGR
jgi:tRNA A-37 threonylcarbamoyl transferase component Bud32